MKRHLALLILALFLGALINLLDLIEGQKVQAQIDAFTFFIPLPADDMDNLFDLGNSDNNFINRPIATVISIALLRDGTIIHYDHWEDGLEDDLAAPIQASTEIWGDNDPTNGIPPGFTSDVLQAGDVIALSNTIPLPRSPALVRYDGGDKLISQGGALALTLVNEPEIPGGMNVLYAGAWELYPTSHWRTEHIIPVGENLAGVRGAFGVVKVNVQAVEDNTTVQLDLNADGSVETTVTLNSGEQYTQISGTTNSGGRILASAPVQVHLFTANNSPGVNYEARAFTIVPRNFWSNDYLAPRSSDGDYWLYNPDTTPLTVTVKTAITVTNILIPANSTAQYPSGALSGATGTRFTAGDGRPFYGIAAISPNQDRDWGYTLLPISMLTPQALVGWAPGNNDTPPSGDENHLYVTAVTTTTLFVDFDQDGIVDVTTTITPLSEIEIIDPDHDLTGALLYTTDGTPFIAVWGQDEAALDALPSIDVGTSIPSIPTLELKKTITLINDLDGSGAISWGDSIRFEIFTTNESHWPLDPPTIISDTVPSSVTYIPNSSTVSGIAIPDDTSGVTLFPFDEGGRLYPQPLAPRVTITTAFDAIVNQGVGEIINTAWADNSNAPPVISTTTHAPVIVARYGLGKRLIDPVSGVAAPGDTVTFSKTITNTGNITITRLPLRDTYNPNHLTFLDTAPFPPDLSASGALTWSNLTAPAYFGPLLPGQTLRLTTTFTVADIPLSVTNTINVAIVEGAIAGSDIPLPPATDEAQIAFPTPTPMPTHTSTPTPTGTPTPESTHTLTPIPTKTPPPAPTDTPAPKPTTPPPDQADTPTPVPNTPTATPSPSASPVPGIRYLPNTGGGVPPSEAQFGTVALAALFLLATGIAVFFVRARA